MNCWSFVSYHDKHDDAAKDVLQNPRSSKSTGDYSLQCWDWSIPDKRGQSVRVAYTMHSEDDEKASLTSKVMAQAMISTKDHPQAIAFDDIKTDCNRVKLHFHPQSRIALGRRESSRYLRIVERPHLGTRLSVILSPPK